MIITSFTTSHSNLMHLQASSLNLRGVLEILRPEPIVTCSVSKVILILLEVPLLVVQVK